MDTLKNKRYERFDYTSRYTPVPYYYDTLAQKDVYGIGTQLSKTTAAVSHKVTDFDTLDSLALKYYNNPTYWWIIAYFNDIIDAFEPLLPKHKVIQIPAINSIEFGAEN